LTHGKGLRGFGIQKADFLKKKLPALQKNDRNLSVRIEKLKKEMESNQG